MNHHLQAVTYLIDAKIFHIFVVVVYVRSVYMYNIHKMSYMRLITFSNQARILSFTRKTENRIHLEINYMRDFLPCLSVL